MRRAVFRHLALLVCLAVLCRAHIGGIFAFGTSFMTALVYCGFPALAAFPVCIAVTVACDVSLAALLYAVVNAATTFVAALLSLRFPRAKKGIYAAFYLPNTASLCLFLYKISPLSLLLWGLLQGGFTVASICVLRPVYEKRLAYKLTETEAVCGGIVLTFLGLGCAQLHVGGLYPAHLLAGFAIPLAAGIGSPFASVAVAVCGGIGIGLSGAGTEAVALLTFAAVAVCVFAAAPRAMTAVAGTAAYVLIGYLFASAPPPPWQFVCFAAGAAVYVLLPRKLLRSWHDLLFAPVATLAARSIIERTVARVGKDLLAAAAVFTDMQTAVGQVATDDVGASALESAVCVDCPRYAACTAQEGYRAALSDMERKSAQCGRVSVSALPVQLTDCARLPELVRQASESASARHDKILLEQAKAEGRQASARQLGLTAQILRGIGERLRAPARFDVDAERTIAEQLAYRGAAVPEVVVSGAEVSVVLQSGALREEDVARTVSSVMRRPYEFVHSETDVLPGYRTILLTRKPRYDVVYSAASGAKEGKSGDNHSFVRLGGDRFMMALCDGEGSGDTASAASTTAIELVESFFRAGLDPESVAENVNRFLADNESERFSTLDVTLVDLNSGEAEILKLSAPATVLRTGEGVRAVAGASLPLGVFPEVSCGRTRFTLGAGDEVLMATDGVTDALGVDGLMSISANAPLDPAALASDVLARTAVAYGGRLRDDCTVLCARLCEN